VAPDVLQQIDEVLAADQRVAAVRSTFSGTAADGGGPMEIAVGWVVVIEDGVCVRCDQYEHGATAAMLARYDELGGSRPATPGERAPERWTREFSRRVPTRDIEALVALFAENHVLHDHRTLGWGRETNGIDGVRAVVESFYEASPDIEVRFEMIACDDRAFAAREIIGGHSADGGSPYEIAIGLAGVIEGGRLRESHHFEDGDRQGMIACFARLGGGAVPLGERPPERFWRDFLCRLATHDVDQIVAAYSPGWRQVDHRDMGWEDLNGLEGARSLAASVLTTTTGTWCEVDEVLACDERAIAFRCRWRGAGTDGVGSYEIRIGYVDVIEDGLRSSTDQYEHDDTDAMLARFAELTTSEPERLLGHYLQLIELRSLDALSAIVAPDAAVADHRALGGLLPGAGPDAAVALARSAIEVTTELRFEIEHVIASTDAAVAVRGTWVGRAAEGEGDVLLSMAVVLGVTNGLISSLDAYEQDDDAAERRVAELTGP
jgi:ketosteroid isomerase-like protein